MLIFSHLQVLDCRLVERQEGVGTFIQREGEESRKYKEVLHVVDKHKHNIYYGKQYKY